MKKSTTANALKNNLKELTSTQKSSVKSKGSSKAKTRTTKAKTTSQNRTKRTTKGTTSSPKTSTTRKAKAGTSTAKSSTKITIVQSRKKDMFPHMGIAHKFPYRFEPMPEIQDKLNLAWFDQYFGEERMIDHIRQHKLKSHQYKAYVNYWWLQETKRRTVT